jgi:exo-1,4-beta-D-glucosaminidase
VSLLDVSSKEVLTRSQPASMAAGAAGMVVELPVLDPKSPVYFLDLKLKGARGQLVSQNFYWLSSKPDVLDPEKNTEPFMPNKSFADFTALNAMPRAKVKITSAFQAGRGQVTLANTSDKVAFFIELQLNKGDTKDPVLPILWDDNYLSLLPGESRTIRATFPDPELHGTRPTLAVTGWNLDR